MILIHFEPIKIQDHGTCSLVGAAQGELPDTKWVPTMNGFTESGGPMHWIRSLRSRYLQYVSSIRPPLGCTTLVTTAATDPPGEKD